MTRSHEFRGIFGKNGKEDMIAKFRCGNEGRANNYQRPKEEKKVGNMVMRQSGQII